MPEYRLILQGVYGMGGIHKLQSNSTKVGNIKTQLINARNIKSNGTKITKNQIDIKIGPIIYNNSAELPTSGMIMVVKKSPEIAEPEIDGQFNNFNANIPKNITKENSCIQVNIRVNGENKTKYLSICQILNQLEDILGGLPEKESEGTYCRPFIFKAPTGEMKKYTVVQFDRMIEIIQVLYDDKIEDDFKIKNRRCIIEAVNEMELQHLSNEDIIKVALEEERIKKGISVNAVNKYPNSVKNAAYAHLCRIYPNRLAEFKMYFKPNPVVTKLINPLKSENEILTKEEVLAILLLLKSNESYQFFHPNRNGTENNSDFQGMSKQRLNGFIEELHIIIANKEMFMVELSKYFEKHQLQQLQEMQMTNLDEILKLINEFNEERLFQDSIKRNNPVEYAYNHIAEILGMNTPHRKLPPAYNPVNRGQSHPNLPPPYNQNWRPPPYNQNWRPSANSITFQRFIQLVNEQLLSEPIGVFGAENGLNTLNKITNFNPNFKIRQLYDEIKSGNIPEVNIKEYVKSRIARIIQSGGKKEYIKLQSGGKRLVRYGPKGGRYYMKGGKRTYIK